MSRLEAGLLRVSRAPYQLADLIAQTVGRLHEPIARLELAIPPGLAPVELDGPRMEIVLRNLLTNALAYGNGAVCVAAEQRDDTVVVRVTDDGPGIAPEELPYLFERFYRAARGQQRRGSGIGLGLAICKSFVEAHSGSIGVESSAAGTTFAITLPLHAQRYPAHAAAPLPLRP